MDLVFVFLCFKPDGNESKDMDLDLFCSLAGWERQHDLDLDCSSFLAGWEQQRMVKIYSCFGFLAGWEQKKW